MNNQVLIWTTIQIVLVAVIVGAPIVALVSAVF